MTDVPFAVEAVLQTATKGRVATPPARRERLIDEFEQSGLSATQFTRLVGGLEAPGAERPRGGVTETLTDYSI